MSAYDSLVQELHPARAPIQHGWIPYDCSPPWDPIILSESTFLPVYCGFFFFFLFLSLMLKFIQGPKEEKEKMLEQYCQRSMT